MKHKLVRLALLAGALAPVSAFAEGTDAVSVMQSAVSTSITAATTVGGAALGIFAALIIFRVVKRAFSAGK